MIQGKKAEATIEEMLRKDGLVQFIPWDRLTDEEKEERTRKKEKFWSELEERQRKHKRRKDFQRLANLIFLSGSAATYIFISIYVLIGPYYSLSVSGQELFTFALGLFLFWYGANLSVETIHKLLE